MKNIKLIIVLFLGISFFISCDSRTQQDLEGIVSAPTYNKNIKPLMDSKCVNCHSQNGQGNFPELDTYQNIVDYQLDNGANGYSQGSGVPSLLCSVQSSSCTSDRMPKSDAPLSNGSINTIKNWIEQGYVEN